jgi:hypothetical protein
MTEESKAICELCGEPMPPGEEMFKYHGYSGDCPKPPKAKEETNKPTVVCLCGSTRFIDVFQRAEFDETLKGRIVLTIGCDSKSDDELFRGPDAAEIKARLDELHKRKIDLADEVLILNVGGYIGSSTKSELEYAVAHGKRVRWLEESGAVSVG